MSHVFSRTTRVLSCALGFGVVAIATPAMAQTTAKPAPAPAAASSAPAASSGSSVTWALDGAVGLALPTASGLDIGPDLQAAGEAWFKALNPIGLRLEVAYDHFGSSGDYSENVIRFVVDGLYNIPINGSKIQPYVLAGLGLYHVSVSFSCPAEDEGFCGDASGSDTKFGFNFGGGVRIPLTDDLQGYAELRLHDLFASGSNVVFPLQVGVRYTLK